MCLFAVCLDGTYGTACSRVCGLCADDQPCNKTTGVCPFGCAEGFLGDLCDTKGSRITEA
ncbi:hypothetical protein DPMN_107192 [Dreissena polymorpha]|uniref:Uncharacterized protein n=1 Tax=Dreissena polymorpha TaxID=45954 RepID=A0A9D4K6P0_DREPO|nr:hypothetical protein DPMN_107192 [Dreissena polymorpha]